MRKLRHLVAHLDRHMRCPQAGIRARHRIVEDDKKAVPGETLDRPLVFVSEPSQRHVILTHHLNHFLGLGKLGKRAEPAQVAEQDGDVCAGGFRADFRDLGW